MPRLFGTDGVRGLANRDLTAQLALDLGDAAVRVLGRGADCCIAQIQGQLSSQVSIG